MDFTLVQRFMPSGGVKFTAKSVVTSRNWEIQPTDELEQHFAKHGLSKNRKAIYRSREMGLITEQCFLLSASSKLQNGSVNVGFGSNHACITHLQRKSGFRPLRQGMKGQTLRANVHLIGPLVLHQVPTDFKKTCRIVL